jgi:signal peptidase II
MGWANGAAYGARQEGARHLTRLALFWATLVSCLAVDQAVKAWIRGRLAEGQSMDQPWPGVFEIKRVTNEGIAFGMFQGMAVVLTPIAVIIALFAIYYSHTHRREGAWTHLAMALLGSGALGNLYDRVFLGGVTDMFWIRAINFPVFNVADICITLATIILVAKWGLEAFKPTPVLEIGSIDEPRLPNTERQTPNSEHRTPNHEPRTTNHEPRFPNPKPQTPNSKLSDSSLLSPIPETPAALGESFSLVEHEESEDASARGPDR